MRLLGNNQATNLFTSLKNVDWTMHNFILKKFKQIGAFYLFFVFYFFVHNRLIIFKKCIYTYYLRKLVL